MRILVRGFRGADRAEFDIDPICLIAGKNGSGKSSVAQAVSAALTGCTIPFFRSTKPDKPIFTKTEAKGLVRGGVDKATVVVTGTEGRMTVEWPKHDVKSEGTPPASTKVAAGLVNPMEMEDESRQKFLSALLECEPKDADILTEAHDQGLTEARGKAMLELIKLQGWDPAYKIEKEKGARLKGQWEAATGTDFGRLKAEVFVPEGWAEDLKQTTLEQLEEHVANARQQVENAVGALAVDVAEVDRLGAEAIAEEQAQLAVDKYAPTLAGKEEAYLDANAAVAAITIPTTQDCPHCNQPLEISGDKITKPKLTAAGIDSLKQSLEKAQRVRSDANVARGLALTTMQPLRDELAKHAGASVRYEQARRRTGNQEALDLARDLLSSLEKRRNALRVKTCADDAFRQILEQVKVVDILAPDGLRRAKLAKALADFNTKTLAPLCAAAGFPPVALNDALDLLYGGRPYYLLSESEKYRARAVLQTAIARIDGSLLVVMDGADVLDSAGREGLFQMLAADDELLFLVCMTVDRPNDVPDLDAAELGVTVWMDGGTAANVEAA